MAIARMLDEQLGATWQMTRELIAGCPCDQWTVGDTPYFVPARQLYHLLDCAQCLCGNPPRPAPTPKPFGPHWDGPAEMIPSQQQLLDLLARVERDAAAWLQGLSNQDCLDPNHLPPFPGVTPLSRVIYAIRHNQYHLAVVNAEARRRDFPRMQWR